MNIESNNNFENKSLRHLEAEKAIAESKENRESLKENISQGIINKLTSKDGYTVRSKDILSLINKLTSRGNHINFNNKGDKIWPGDKIRIVSGKVFRTHNGEDQIVGVVTEGFKKNEVESRKEAVFSDAPAVENPETVIIEEEVPAKTIIPADKAPEIIVPIAKAPTAKEAPAAKPAINETSIEKTETIGTISNYFNIDKNKLNTLTNQLKENGLNLDLVKFLTTYKKYIEANLIGLDNKILEKIKKSIGLRVLELSKIVTERIAWVDEQIEEEDYKKEDRQKEIQNQRWIINSNLNDLFSEINNEVLPSAVVLAKKIDTNSLDDDLEITDMFDADLTDDGEFNKTIWSGELIDANANYWSVIDTTDEDHAEFLKENKVPTIEGTNLLSEKDSEIEKKAQIAWFAAMGVLVANDVASFTGIWTIPGLIIGAGYDIHDAISDEDTSIILLKEMGLVDKNYVMDKSITDNLLATVGIIPGATAALKSVKLGKFIDKLSPKEIKYFNKIKENIGEFLKAKIQKVSNNKTVQNISQTAKKGKEKIINQTNKVSDNIKNSYSKNKEAYIHKKTGKTYYKNKEGKFINENGKTVNVKPENLNKVETLLGKIPFEKFKKIIEKKLETVYNGLSKEKQAIIDKRGGFKKLPLLIAKDIFFNKWNLGFATLFGISDLVMDREKDNGDRVSDFLESLLYGYLFGGIFYIGGKALKLTGYSIGKIKDLVVETGKLVMKHKGKLFIAASGTWITYELFYDEGNEKESPTKNTQ